MRIILILPITVAMLSCCTDCYCWNFARSYCSVGLFNILNCNSTNDTKWSFRAAIPRHSSPNHRGQKNIRISWCQRKKETANMWQITTCQTTWVSVDKLLNFWHFGMSIQMWSEKYKNGFLSGTVSKKVPHPPNVSFKFPINRNF